MCNRNFNESRQVRILHEWLKSFRNRNCKLSFLSRSVSSRWIFTVREKISVGEFRIFTCRYALLIFTCRKNAVFRLNYKKHICHVIFSFSGNDVLPKCNFGNLLHECEHVSIKLKILGDASTIWLLSSFKEYGIN